MLNQTVSLAKIVQNTLLLESQITKLETSITSFESKSQSVTHASHGAPTIDVDVCLRIDGIPEQRKANVRPNY